MVANKSFVAANRSVCKYGYDSGRRWKSRLRRFSSGLLVFSLVWTAAQQRSAVGDSAAAALRLQPGTSGVVGCGPAPLDALGFSTRRSTGRVMARRLWAVRGLQSALQRHEWRPLQAGGLWRPALTNQRRAADRTLAGSQGPPNHGRHMTVDAGVTERLQMLTKTRPIKQEMRND